MFNKQARNMLKVAIPKCSNKELDWLLELINKEKEVRKAKKRVKK